jgi:hypothetical protein
MSPNGKGIDQHSTWFQIGRDRLSSTKEMEGNVEIHDSDITEIQ